MQSLQRDDLENVRKIKSLQTSYSSRYVPWQCPVSCSDLNMVKDFIQSVDSLEKLSVLNYEPDVSALWAAVFHHAKSLSHLEIHGPPQMQLDIWTASAIQKVGNDLPELKDLELDVSLEEAERYLADDSVDTEPKKDNSILDEVAKLNRLESILINVNLQDAPSKFSAQHTWNVMGCISFPPPNKETCKELAQQIFGSFSAAPAGSCLKHLELRFPRRCWDDRCQFWTLAYSVHVKKSELGVTVEADDSWKPYLPAEPEFGNSNILRRLINEAYEERRLNRM